MSCAGFSSSGEPLDFYFSFSSGQTGGEELYLGEVEGDDEAELTTRWVNIEQSTPLNSVLPEFADRWLLLEIFGAGLL